MLWLEIHDSPDATGHRLKIRADAQGLHDLVALLAGEPVRLIFVLPSAALEGLEPRAAGIRRGHGAGGNRAVIFARPVLVRERHAMLQRRRHENQIWRQPPARRRRPGATESPPSLSPDSKEKGSSS